MGKEATGLLSFTQLRSCEQETQLLPWVRGHRLVTAGSRAARWERLHVRLLLLSSKSRWHYREPEILVSFGIAEYRLE